MKILLIEDDDVLRQAMLHLIPRWGHDLDTASNGENAIEKIQHEHYDLVFLDEQLPDTRGRQLATTLRSLSNNASLIIIGLTGYVDPDERHTFLEAGMDNVAQKPLTQKTFEAILNSLPATIP